MRTRRVTLPRLAATACAVLIAGTTTGQEIQQPFFDGLCTEYEALGVPSRALGSGVELYIYSGPETVWFCYTIPPDSYGTLDLYISTPALDDPLNLHVSAQLGEWRADHPDEAPQGSSSPLWWQIDGWYSNAASFNGSIDTDDGRRPNFLSSPARELALQRSRFGNGDWSLRFEIGAVQQPNGERATVHFPSRESGEE